MKIGIVGLGLIGGSLAKALRKNTDYELVGADKDFDVLRQARREGCIGGGSDLRGASVVFVCLPPRAAVEWMLASSLPDGTIVCDTCGIKRFIAKSVAGPLLERGIRYVGTHPMAGREVGGFRSSLPDLFEGRSWILVRLDATDPAALRTVETVVRAAGAQTVPVTSAEAHDRVIAYTSQMAHVVSNAYVKNEAALEERDFSAGSFQDLTRVARLDADLWTELFLENADNLVQNLDEYIENVRAARNAIAAGDEGALRLLLKQGSDRRIQLTRMERAARG